MMSTKHEEIDLNADAVSGDRENEVHSPVIRDSVTETLTQPFTRQGEFQSLEVDKVRVFDSAEVICDLNIGGNDVNMDSDSLDRGVDAKVEENNGNCGDDVSTRDENEVEVGPVAERASGEAEIDHDTHVGSVDAKVEENSGKCGDDVSMRDENEVEGAPVAEIVSGEAEIDRDANVGSVDLKVEESNGKCGADVSMREEKEVEGASVAERASGGAEIDHDTNVGSVGDVLEQETDNRDTIKSLHQKFEEATSDGLENQAVEVDRQSQLEVNEDQLVDVCVAEVRGSSDVLTESYAVNPVVDLVPCMTTDRNGSGDANANLVASQPEFCAGDLVWGKVRSHPWWPGQIFDPSAASQKAKKYVKKDSHLVAYFGDHTFAWNKESKLKPFREHFAQMEKQTSMEDFHYAIDCTLEEVSRRVEFGLACSCIPKEAYARIKNQIIVNAGIRKESSTIDGGDSYSNAAFFEPVELLEKVKTLAQLPYNSEVDRLEFVTLKAQLSAFHHWKGYLELPEFNMLVGLLENEADIPLSGEANKVAEVTQSAATDFSGDKQVSSKIGKLKSQDGSSRKRKHISGDSIHPGKKEKSLMDLLAERPVNVSNGRQGTDGKGVELISSSSEKKRRSVDTTSDDRAVKHKKLDSILDDVTVKKKNEMLEVKYEKGDLSVGAVNKCLPIKKTFGVGNSILKVASQLNGSNPIFKSGDRTSQKSVIKNNSIEKSLFRKSQSKKQFPSEQSSPDELLSQLCVAARDPMEVYYFLLPLVGFFSKFRNSVSLEQCHEEFSGDKTQKTQTESEATEISRSDPMENIYWTDRIIQNNPQEQQAFENKNEAGELLHETPSSPVGPASAVQLSPVDTLGGCFSKDPSPTALVLNFTDFDSVPSKENLNKIFSHYGPLNELETEVMKSKRAKVVFKRRADAEAAFSSAGKYSIFGPSLVSYCLKYMPSTQSKPSSHATKRGRKAATSQGENAT